MDRQVFGSGMKFLLKNQQPTHGVMMRIYSNGSVSWSFVAGGGPGIGHVVAIALQPDGKILVGGYFDSYAGLPRNRIARLNPDGSLDVSFEPSLAVPHAYWAGFAASLAPQSDGKILVGGEFATVNGVARTNLARLNPYGRLDESFASAPALVPVAQVVVQDDDRILFLSGGGLFRLNPDGTLDETFHLPGLSGNVSCMALQPDGKIVVGSSAGLSWGYPPAMTLRLNVDGSLDSSFVPLLAGEDPAQSLDSIALVNDGRIYVGGGVTFTTNAVQAGNLYGGRAQDGGGQSWGGAVVQAGGESFLSNCVFMANQTIGTTRVASVPYETGDANGGAVSLQNGSMVVEGTLFSGNSAKGGGGLERGETNTVSAPGNGGAIFNQSGNLRLLNSGLVFNEAKGGPVTSAPPWGSRAALGSGGAIYSAGIVSMMNCALAENSASGGLGGDNVFGGYGLGGPAYGGGIYLAAGSASLVNVTVAGNSVQAGNPVNPDVLGASIAVANGTAVMMTNTIVCCASSQTNVYGAIIDGGHNICSDGSANFTSPSSYSKVDPLLGPLGAYGGLTPTLSLLPASPAIDAGDDSVCPPTDQRGVPRPKGSACDIGAFELAASLRLSSGPEGKVLVEYQFRANVTNLVSFSTNLADWMPLGTKVSDTNGVSQIDEINPLEDPRRFYRVQVQANP
jgi:uncharacterized delta-60 repeat protein